MNYGISREEENKLPVFKSHAEAKHYFKDKYGDNLIFLYEKDGDYFYRYIIDREAYLEMRERIDKEFIIELTDRYAFASQDIQISVNGEVHIVH